MKIFVAAPYSARVDWESREVFPDHQARLEKIMGMLERLGHTVICALREDGYKINNDDPAAAFHLDFDSIDKADAFFAVCDNIPSTGVAMEIGWALSNVDNPEKPMKKVFLAHDPDDALDYLPNAAVAAGKAEELILPPIPEGDELPVIPEDWVQKLSA
jgi:hypothetical protein